MEIVWTYSKRLRRKRTKKFLDIRLCSLHIIHGAFKSGAEKNDWDIKSIFKTTYTIFHDTPAWREDFISVTGEERFPLFFSATVVANKLIEIWESIITKIVRQWE